MKRIIKVVLLMVVSGQCLASSALVCTTIPPYYNTAYTFTFPKGINGNLVNISSVSGILKGTYKIKNKTAFDISATQFQKDGQGIALAPDGSTITFQLLYNIPISRFSVHDKSYTHSISYGVINPFGIVIFLRGEKLKCNYDVPFDSL